MNDQSVRLVVEALVPHTQVPGFAVVHVTPELIERLATHKRLSEQGSLFGRDLPTQVLTVDTSASPYWQAGEECWAPAQSAVRLCQDQFWLEMHVGDDAPVLETRAVSLDALLDAIAAKPGPTPDDDLCWANGSLYAGDQIEDLIVADMADSFAVHYG